MTAEDRQARYGTCPGAMRRRLDLIRKILPVGVPRPFTERTAALPPFLPLIGLVVRVDDD